MQTEQFDYVIVGAGTAGCVLANRLTETGNHKVLVLEAGPEDRSPWIHIPLGYGKTVYDERYARRFRTRAEPNMNGREFVWPRGVCVGGSSSINGMVVIRGQREDYDQWANDGNPSWGWNDVLPYFIKLEHNTRGASEFHGVDGPLWASDMSGKDELMEAIFDGAEELGVPRNDDFNGKSQFGAGYYQFFIKGARRCSASVAYLRPAIKRPNLTVKTGSMARCIIFEQKRAIGIEYVREGIVHRALAKAEVILTAGAIQSPQLLQLSGIGPAQLLRDLGIQIVQPLEGVGKNLQDHLQIPISHKISKAITLNDDLNSLRRKAIMGLRYALFKEGPLSMPAATGGLFTQVLPSSTRPDVQFHFSKITAEALRYKPHLWSGATFSVCQLRPESVGELRITSTDPQIAPEITANYLTAEVDQECAIRAIKFARELADTHALHHLIKEEYRPGRSQQSDEELLEHAKNMATTIFHPSGTCKMGIDPMAVVDQELRVYGVEGLRVVDCSVMPRLISGNTNAPTAMIAEKAADLIRGIHP